MMVQSLLVLLKRQSGAYEAKGKTVGLGIISLLADTILNKDNINRFPLFFYEKILFFYTKNI